MDSSETYLEYEAIATSRKRREMGTCRRSGTKEEKRIERSRPRMTVASRGRGDEQGDETEN